MFAYETDYNSYYSSSSDDVISDEITSKEISSDEISIRYAKETDKIVEILHEIYPNLNSDSMYWAPEIFWIKIKEYTGIDLMEILRTYHEIYWYTCRDCRNNKLKKLIIQKCDKLSMY